MRRDTEPHPASEDALAWLGLAIAPGFPPRRAFTLVEKLGSAAAVLRASRAELAAAGLDGEQLTAVLGTRDRARREAAALAARGASVVTWADAGYPARLREIADAPPMLAVRGALARDDAHAVAIVGTRRASEYGRRVAEELATGLVQAGLTVVSGLAAGIDGAAHRAALAAGGRTIAVLGTGVDVVYPSWHGDLAEAIAEGGALVSEFPLGTPPLAHHFPRRNRIISGMTLGTVVVEAAEQSGSLITAAYAVEQNRQVFAVPGPIGTARHHGPHRLIQEGAKLVTRVEDVLEELAPALVARLAVRRTEIAVDGLAPEERRLLDALDRDGRHVDDLIRDVGVPPAVLLETLLALELRGLVRQLPGRRFSRLAA